MAHLWVEEKLEVVLEAAKGGGGGGRKDVADDVQETERWAVAPLDGARFALADTPRRIDANDDATDVADIVLMRLAPRNEWVLLAAGSRTVRVNGTAVPGMRRLLDRDEITVTSSARSTKTARSNARFFFTSERLAQVAAFPVSPRKILCPRCKTEVEEGEPAVRCPGCDLWHHQGERSCWTFAERCAGCDHPTELPATFRWTPDTF